MSRSYTSSLPCAWDCFTFLLELDVVFLRNIWQGVNHIYLLLRNIITNYFKRIPIKFTFVFWDVLPCKIFIDRRFRGTCCLHHRSVGRQLFYTAVHPRRQIWTSYSPPWELEISQNSYRLYLIFLYLRQVVYYDATVTFRLPAGAAWFTAKTATVAKIIQTLIHLCPSYC
jgi:hypothetical protein